MRAAAVVQVISSSWIVVVGFTKAVWAPKFIHDHETVLDLPYNPGAKKEILSLDLALAMLARPARVLLGCGESLACHKASAFTINVQHEHEHENVHMYQMLVSYTVPYCPQVFIGSVPRLPAVAMAVKARHGLNESRGSAQGMFLWALIV